MPRQDLYAGIYEIKHLLASSSIGIFTAHETSQRTISILPSTKLVLTRNPIGIIYFAPLITISARVSRRCFFQILNFRIGPGAMPLSSASNVNIRPMKNLLSHGYPCNVHA